MSIKEKSNGRGSGIHYAWICASGGFLTQTVGLISTSILPIILVMFESALRISPMEAGALVSVNLAFTTIGTPVWGVASDKVGLRKSLTLGSLVTSIGILSMSFVDSLATAMLAYAVAGFGAGALFTLVPKLLGIWFDVRRRGIASSFITSGGSGPASVLGVVVPLIAVEYSWRSPFLVFGLSCLLFTAMIYLTVRDSPREKGLAAYGSPADMADGDCEADPSEQQVKALDVLRMRETWHLSGVFLPFYMCTTLVMTFLVSYLMERGMAPEAAGIGYSVYMLATLLGQYLFGFFSDKVPRKYIITFGALLAFITYGLITVTNGSSGTYVIVGTMGLSSGAMLVVLAMIGDYFDPRVTGTASGVIMVIGGLGGMVAPVFAGYLTTMTGTLASTFLFSASLAVAMAIVVVTLKQPSR